MKLDWRLQFSQRRSQLLMSGLMCCLGIGIDVYKRQDNPEENRGIFQKLYQFSVDIASKNIDNVTMDELSMGMSNDFEVAIEEGATMVRVGTSIFGARSYPAP